MRPEATGLRSLVLSPVLIECVDLEWVTFSYFANPGLSKTQLNSSQWPAKNYLHPFTKYFNGRSYL